MRSVAPQNAESVGARTARPKAADGRRKKISRNRGPAHDL
jgi:hypothetical protein